MWSQSSNNDNNNNNEINIEMYGFSRELSHFPHDRWYAWKIISSRKCKIRDLGTIVLGKGREGNGNIVWAMGRGVWGRMVHAQLMP